MTANHRLRFGFFAPMLLLMAFTLLSVWACGGGDDPVAPKPLQPTLSAADPDSGNVGTLITLSGSDFTSAVSVSFGGIAVASVTQIDATTLVVNAPEGLVANMSYDIEVTNRGGLKSSVVDGYRAVLPNLQVINGVSRPSGNSNSTIILEGRAFGDIAINGSVLFTDAGGATVNAPILQEENWTNDFIVTIVPSAAVSGDVWLETPTGNSAPIAFTVTQSATFSPSLINWTATQSLPSGRQGHNAVFLAIESGASPANVVYVTGGDDDTLTPKNEALSSVVGVGGDLTTWIGENSLPEARAYHGSVMASPFNSLIDGSAVGHLYVIGGIAPDSTASSSVYRAAVNEDHSLGAWDMLSPLPNGVHSMGVAIFRSWIYVAGGADSDHVPTADVYRARIALDGSIGLWEAQSSLPAARTYFDLAQFAGRLYAVGGELGTVAPASPERTGSTTADIHTVDLNLRTGELLGAAWALDSGSLIKSVSKHSAVVAGGTMFVSGGIYNGVTSSSSEHQYSAIATDLSLGSFNGATGSQTIANLGGAPFYNHAAVVYIDTAGQAHVIVIGGADASDPATMIPFCYFY